MSKKVFSKILIIILLLLSLCSCNILKNKSFSEDKFEIHFIDVGQGDSILIHVNNKTLLIDSGPKDSASTLINYLNSYNVKKIDYLIATHPHDDHIGSLSYIIKRYSINSFYSPKIQSTGKIYENMIDELKNKKLKINILKEGVPPINLGKDISIKVLSPSENSSLYKDNLNNSSVVFLIKYKNTSFLLTGDAEKEVEQNILGKNQNIKANVLKLGHHGSDSSTSEAFLKAVSPSIGIISCGKDNPYGHPHEKVLKLLKKYNVKTYRTDKDGSIRIISDGNKIIVL
ncbi:competence protein ComEC [Clostridium sp. DSM 8431]|uniref:ComEC/Rec2 family competence protein n=1 Tax=Clostridium sp. DSM 8431 TaxID=1761781 RepID=UPI0008E2B269|nr:ComEC/Rec2 family competence protein [Clostridium sp. DSM 8431]SFU56810.1 competence protein ComEC [Clostridium sp. DSM 8431]